jgi:hypothetical protein
MSEEFREMLHLMRSFSSVIGLSAIEVVSGLSVEVN